MTGGRPEPLIVTVALDPASQAHFDRLRERHFPPALNYLPAHVTLFHHLPGERLGEIDSLLAASCRAQPPQAFTATGLRFLGRGSAYLLDMPGVASLRRSLADSWTSWLTPQDKQTWKPHVTVQNKVPAATARQVHADLERGFAPVQGRAVGLHLWAYLDGPWEALGLHLFSADG